MSNFLKTRQGLQYLCKNFPNLSVEEAVTEFKIASNKRTN